MDLLMSQQNLSISSPRLDQFKQRSNACQKDLIFLELLSYVLGKLKVLFDKFKRSPMFVELEDEISR